MHDKHTHSGRLERWLGSEGVASVSEQMRTWYGPPIAVSGVPGNVWAQRGGDFTGDIRAGYEATAMDHAREIFRRLHRGYRRACRPGGQLNTGFASLSDLISEVTINGKRQELLFQKTGSLGASTGGSTNSLWRAAGHPPAASAASAAPGGDAPTSSTTGALMFTNPSGGDTTHITTVFPIASIVANTLLIYDRLFQVAKTMNSTGTEAVSGVPSRYQSITAADPDYIGGNFLFPECGTVLPATSHNWTVCTYKNQANAGATLPLVAGVSACRVQNVDLPAQTFFAPLASGDIGVKALTQMQCSALVATGAIDFVIGHPLAWLPCPIAGIACTLDGINSAFGLVRVFDNACLAFLEITKPVQNATSYCGSVLLAAG